MKLSRVLRIIEYVGDREWVDERINARSVKGRRDIPGKGYITEAILGETPEILEYSALQQAAEDLVNRLICPVCEGGKVADPKECRRCGGRAYVSAVENFDETVEELRREADKILSRAAKIDWSKSEGDGWSSGRLGEELSRECNKAFGNLAEISAEKIGFSSSEEALRAVLGDGRLGAEEKPEPILCACGHGATRHRDGCYRCEACEAIGCVCTSYIAS